MMLLDAIRQFKEGQEIVLPGNEADLTPGVARWNWGKERPVIHCLVRQSDWSHDVAIRDLPRPTTLHDVLVKGLSEQGLEAACGRCQHTRESCEGMGCPVALIDTLQDIALAAGFDLKKVVK